MLHLARLSRLAGPFRLARLGTLLSTVLAVNAAFAWSPPYLPVDESFDGIVSEGWADLVAVNPMSGSQRAALLITGVAHTQPPFSIGVSASYDDGLAQPTWTIRELSLDPPPPGFGKPEFASDDGLPFVFPGYAGYTINGYRVHSLVVRSTGSVPYRMSWTVTGQATPDIAPVLLPAFRCTPWRGEKRGWILKGRVAPDQDPGYDQFGPADVELRAMIDPPLEAISRMSRGVLSMTYEIKEAAFAPPPGETSFYPIAAGLLATLGIDETNFRDAYDWQVTTYYAGLRDATDSHGPQGATPSADAYPQVGPGCFYPDLSYPSHRGPTFLHETGHGILQAGQHPMVNAGCSDLPDEERLFHVCWGSTGTPFEDDMSGMCTLWWNPIWRATQGWLQASQVTLVTVSGIYDLWSDAEDFTSDPSEPLILLIALERAGRTEYLHVIVPNQQSADEAARINNTPAIAEGCRGGIQIVTASEDPGSRNGVGQASTGKTMLYYSKVDPASPYDTSLHPGEEARFAWEGTEVQIRNLGREGRHARVGILIGPFDPFRRGDANGDGERDISDALAILFHLFLANPPLACMDAADANDSGTLDISDAVFLLSCLFLGDTAPNEPIGSCGGDPTPDELTCASFEACR